MSLRIPSGYSVRSRLAEGNLLEHSSGDSSSRLQWRGDAASGEVRFVLDDRGAPHDF
jgi:hypothetical protein